MWVADEHGFDADFDVSPFLAKALEHAHRKVAVRFEKTPLTKAPEALEKAIQSYPKGFPTPVLFLQSGKDGSDTLVTFDQDSSEAFLNGMRYARRLAALSDVD